MTIASLLLTNCRETEESVLPFADVQGALVQRKQSRHPAGNFGTDREQLSGKVTSQLRFPHGRRVEPVVVTRSEVDDALVEDIVGGL